MEAFPLLQIRLQTREQQVVDLLGEELGQTRTEVVGELRAGMATGRSQRGPTWKSARENGFLGVLSLLHILNHPVATTMRNTRHILLATCSGSSTKDLGEAEEVHSGSDNRHMKLLQPFPCINSGMIFWVQAYLYSLSH